MSFFKLSVQVRVLKNKVLVHFCTFSCATFNFEYDFLDISIILNAKVSGYSREGTYDVISGKWRLLETFDDEAFNSVSSASLNLI